VRYRESAMSTDERMSDLNKLSEILNEFLDEDQAREFTSKIEQEVAQKTSDKTLRTLLETLSSLYTAKPSRKEHLKKIVLTLLVTFHMFVITINVVAFFILPFLYPLLVWMPLNSFILTVTFTREICPLTRLENYMRTSMGIPRIGGFIGHYFVRPIKRAYITYKIGLGSSDKKGKSNDRSQDNSENEKKSLGQSS
jgi:hypothetical protein